MKRLGKIVTAVLGVVLVCAGFAMGGIGSWSVVGYGVVCLAAAAVMQHMDGLESRR